ncbi:DUF1573 domain-containing protein [Paracrocinitomix mangrovi]|uniref:DUF1573 domain-containing protein n=1 Tax=Paracrocinitomix mangrovi TaxID=2862509 RepID=UPI001EDA028B|nr:DUF1573 domain-containing protein [Paracrocinitomix mangrovi]UKN01582.1 DUF1573 domain-containing protein [Paracrocinitomix mangrovi]
MRKFLMTFSLICASAIVTNFTFAQNNGTPDPVEPTSGAVLKMNKDVHDYGTITQGDDGNCTFTITNTGTEALIISLCKGSCGCTVPVCPQEPIPPGESVDITVKYNTSKVGPIQRSVTISSNASNEPKKVIRIKGNVKAKPTGSAPFNTGGPTVN